MHIYAYSFRAHTWLFYSCNRDICFVQFEYVHLMFAIISKATHKDTPTAHLVSLV